MSSQAELAEQFRALHHQETPLLLANAWDALSAAVVADAGLPAVATASAAVALSRGYDDGEQISLDELVRLVECIANVVTVPITVDFERGYGEMPSDVGASAERLIAAGAVGVNIEDSIDHETLRDTAEQCERIGAIREAGQQADVAIFINARTDAFMLGKQDGIGRLEAYAAAGADGVYPILCHDLATLDRVHTATMLPINTLLTPSVPPLESLVSVGVRRLSLGPGLLSAAAGAARLVARRLAAGDLQLEDLPQLTTAEMRRMLGI